MREGSRIRTDLALETTERFQEENVEIRGVEIQEDYNKERDIRTTIVKITTENGARLMGRPQGNYITIEAPELSSPDEDYHREISEEVAVHLRNLIDLETEKSILVVGLGNQEITADSLGPHVVENLKMTRHLVREYGLKESGRWKDSPDQWNRSRCNGADRNGNFRDYPGCGTRDKTRCGSGSRCIGCQKYPQTQQDYPDYRHRDTSRLWSRKPQKRAYRRNSESESDRHRSTYSGRCGDDCP